MSKFDENLFGRIALLNDYLTKEELDSCLEDQRRAVTRKNIGQVLLEQGYLNEEQLNRILDIRKKKVRKYLRRQDNSARNDQEIGKLLLEWRLIELEGLESAVLEQQRLRQLNLHFSLAEVLVSREQVSVDDILRVYSRQGWRMLCCGVCDAHYRIVDFEDDVSYRCPRCDEPLEAPAFLDVVMVDGVIDSGALELESDITAEIV